MSVDISLADRVRHLAESGDTVGALVALARAVETLQADAPAEKAAPVVAEGAAR